MAEICGLANPGINGNLVLEVTPEEMETLRRALDTAMEHAERVGATAEIRDLDALITDFMD